MYKYPEYTNEELVDAFEDMCVEWCETINFDRGNTAREDKVIRCYDRIRAELLSRLNSREAAS